METQLPARAGKVAIKGADIVAYDGREHRLLDEGVLVFEDDTITYVGRSYEGHVDRTIEAGGKLVIPGMISCHAHVSAQEGNRMVTDLGRRDFLRSGFLNYVPTRHDGGTSFFAKMDVEASVRYGMASLIRNGVTTVIDFNPGVPDNGATVVRLAGEMGLRLYFAPTVTGAHYHFDNEGHTRLRWDEAGGVVAFEAVEQFIERYHGAHEGRVNAMVTLDEAFTATPRLLERAKSLAAERGIGITMHCAEQVYEFHQTVREQGRTPIQVLDDLGFLGPEIVLAHCLYLTGHSYVGYPYGDDLELLAKSGTAVAHSPVVYARRGIALESFQRYRNAGVNVALGTDAFPLDLFDEMRQASLVCKLVEQNHEAAPAADCFAAATLGGARALRREDLGRLSVGTKADIVIVNLRNLRMGPVFDPIRALVHLGSSDMVETVVVDGRILVDEKRLQMCDEEEVLSGAIRSADAMWGAFSDYHWAGRGAYDEFPPSLAKWEAQSG